MVDGSLPENRVKAQLLVEHNKHFLLFNEVLYYDYREKSDDVGPDYDLRPMRIAVPEHLRKQILHEAHGTDLPGHFGISIFFSISMLRLTLHVMITKRVLCVHNFFYFHYSILCCMICVICCMSGPTT